MNKAIYIAEYSSIPVGIDAVDRMVKRASMTIIYAKPICIGKFLIVMGGEVDNLREAQAEVASAGEKRLIQQYLLTNAHEDILAYFKRSPQEKRSMQGKTALGILETRNASSGFQSLDAALKSGNVRLEEVWIGHFIGGKFCYILSGLVEDINTALEAAARGLPENSFIDKKVIASPDDKTLEYLIKSYKL